MTDQQTVSFSDTSQIDFFKCVLLFQRIEKEKAKFPNNPERVYEKSKLYSLKRSLQPEFNRKFSQFRDDLDIGTAENFAKEHFLKIKIWKQVSYRRPFFLEYESDTDDENLNKYKDLNLFSRKFDKYNNQDFSQLSLILDIQKFSKQKKIDHSQNRIEFRQMTFFQAVVTELFPDFQGKKFYRKVAEFEENWTGESFHLGDTKKFYQQYGLGIQIWTKVVKPDYHHEIQKVWDSLYKKKLRIQIDDFKLEDRIPLKMNIRYIHDDSALNYFSCPNRHCFFGTHRLDRLQRHIGGCRTTTKIEYAQNRYGKPDETLREQLYKENILPEKDFNNMMFAVYDIGKFSILRSFSASYLRVDQVSSESY